MDQQIWAIQRSDPIHLETLILDLMKPSNEQRSKAEFLFNSCKEDCADNLVVNLADLLKQSLRLEVRAMSAILLRNLVQDELLWNSLLEMTRSRVKNGLLNCVVNEENKPIIKILGNTISKLAADKGWPELMTFMFNGFASVDFWLKESALLIFAQLAQYVADSLVQIAPIGAQLALKTRLHDGFMDCLGNGGSADVRIAALSAVIDFIQCLKSSSDRDWFEDFLPRMFQCVTAELNPGNEATAQKALVLLIELAGIRPSFFRGRGRMVEGMLQIAEAESLEEGTRRLAIEFLVTSAEEKCNLPRFIISRLCAILMRMLLADTFGKECLHRLATALGGNTIVPVAYEYLSAPNHKWQKHLAGLVALAQIAKRRSKVEIPNLEQVVTMVSNSFQDPPHPRVKWAAINAIGQLSTYVGPSLLDQYHNRVLPALDSALDDVQNPRVQACAASAVFKIKIRATCPTHILEPYLDGILSKLIVLPQTGRNIEVLRLANSLKESTNDVETRRWNAILLGEMFEEALAALTKHTRLLGEMFEEALAALTKHTRLLGKMFEEPLAALTKHTRDRSAILLGEMFEEPLPALTKHTRDRSAILLRALTKHTRDKSEILLREMFEEPLAALTKHLVKYILLKCVKEERERSVLKRLCHTIAMFYNAFCMKTGWPELICFVEQRVVSGSGQNLSYNDLLEAEAAMLILGPLRLFMECHPESLVVYYARYLENANSTDIRIAAFGAAIGYIRCTHKVMDTRLVPAMTRVLTEGEEVMTQKALKLLIEWAHQIKHPWFSVWLSESYYSESYDSESYDTGSYDTNSYDRNSYKYFSGSQLVGFVSSAIEIAESQCLRETKHLAIDFMITLGEGRDSHHELMTNKLFGILMSDIENEAASHWAENEDDDAGELRTCSVVLKFLDRLAFRLDTVSWRKLEQYLGAEWQKRVIAINILALAQISKVYLKVTKKSFDELVTMMLYLFQDSHYRVRLAAIHATGQLSADLDPNLQLQYHRRVLAALAEAICDFEYPQVQKDAASAVINISKNYPRDTLTPDLVKIVGTLLEFRSREDIASDQTRILSIENLLKQFRVKLPPDTWASTRSQLLDHQDELLKILAHKEDQEEST